MHELTVVENTIKLNDDYSVTLVGYEKMLEQLDQIGEYLCSYEVTPENIKEAKSVVAQLRNACKDLNAQKIAFRKEYMKPIDKLYEQVKTIDNRCLGYEETVRSQIRNFEEQEKEEKKEEIRQLFQKKLRPYGGKEVRELFNFDTFFKNEYLRKSYSMNQIEKEMAEFFEQTTQDINALVAYSNNTPFDKDEIVLHYVECGDVSETITHYNKIAEDKEKVKKAMEERKVKPTQKVESTFLLRIKEGDYAKTTNLLRAAGIDFELV